jgi:hypothetical protein
MHGRAGSAGATSAGIAVGYAPLTIANSKTL